MGFFLTFFRFRLRGSQGQQAQCARGLMPHGHKLAVHHPDFIKSKGFVAVNDFLRDGAGQRKVQAAHTVTVSDRDVVAGLAHSVASFAAHAGEGDLHTGIGFFSSELQGRGDDVAVEAAAQTTIGRDQHDGAVFLFLMLGQQRMGSALHLAGKLGQNLAILAGIRPEAFDAGLRAAQFRRGHHVHSLGDLLGLADPHDFHFYVFE